jgi:hypothetical protein
VTADPLLSRRRHEQRRVTSLKTQASSSEEDDRNVRRKRLHQLWQESLLQQVRFNPPFLVRPIFCLYGATIAAFASFHDESSTPPLLMRAWEGAQ